MEEFLPVFSMGKSWRPQISQRTPRQGAKCPAGKGSAPASGRLGGAAWVPKGTWMCIDNYMAEVVSRGVCYMACISSRCFAVQAGRFRAKATPESSSEGGTDLTVMTSYFGPWRCLSSSPVAVFGESHWGQRLWAPLRCRRSKPFPALVAG